MVRRWGDGGGGGERKVQSVSEPDFSSSEDTR